MSRRSLLILLTVGAAAAFPASALAAPHFGVKRGAKTTKHLIAVRHGHKIVWKVRNHGLAHGKHVAMKLTSRVAFAHALTVDQPTINVTDSGGPGCASAALTTNTGSFIADFETYAQSLYSDVLDCSGNNGSTTEANAESNGPACNLGGESVSSGPFVSATFMDGENALVCNVPDDNGLGDSLANNYPFKVYQQGFACQATAGTGSLDKNAYNTTDNDSIEVYQTYTNYGGLLTSSVVSVCVGQLPSNTQISSQIVTNLVGCSQVNPFTGGVITGYGESITYPNHQYSEYCDTPNYQS